MVEFVEPGPFCHIDEYDRRAIDKSAGRDRPGESILHGRMRIPGRDSHGLRLLWFAVVGFLHCSE